MANTIDARLRQIALLVKDLLAAERLLVSRYAKNRLTLVYSCRLQC